jgi:hypothetical protein
VLRFETPPAPPTLQSLLTERGITAATATELVGLCTADELKHKLEVCDWLVSKRDKRVSKNPAGYFAESIRKNYSTPKGFESTTERNERLAAESEQQRKAEAEKQARDAAERRRIDAFWATLSTEAQERLWVDTLKNPSLGLMANLYRRSPANSGSSERYRRMLLDAHINALLENPDSGGKPNS